MSNVLRAALLLALSPSAALAFGPAMHMREADVVLDRLAEGEQTVCPGDRPLAWAEVAAHPLARAYLHLGAFSPDLTFVAHALPFEHGGSAFSFGLLAEACADQTDARPLRLAFALGNLCHHSSDSSAETLLTPTLFASVPVGLTDLFDDGRADGRGESEAITEAMSEAYSGDWDAVIDTAFVFRYEDDQARDRLEDAIGWYCERGGALVGRQGDCETAVAEVDDTLKRLDVVVGGRDRESARQLVETLVVRQSPASLMRLLASLSGALMGEAVEPSPRFEEQLAAALASPLVDRELWNLYEAAFTEVGPALALARLATGDTGWPNYDGNAITCGNLQSVLASAPEHFSVRPGLHVSELTFVDETGQPVSEATAGGRYVAQVRLFSALPFAGTLTGVVQADAPGLSADGEPLGEQSLAVALEPTELLAQGKVALDVPFTATEAQGFVVTLYADDDPLPFFTTSWDTLWAAARLDLTDPLYQENFGTYGHWPSSLPRAGASPERLALVRVRVAPLGPGLSGATVSLGDEAHLTGPAGNAAFTPLGDSALVSASLAGYAPSDSTPLALADGTTLATVALHAIPEPTAWPFAQDCVVATLDPTPFAGQAAGYQFWLTHEGDEVASAETEEPGASLCPDGLPDGAQVQLFAAARYEDGTEGVVGEGPEITLDQSPPTIGLTLTAEEACGEGASALAVEVNAQDPESGLELVAWALAESGPYTALASNTFALPEGAPGALWVRATNQAGGTTVVSEPRPLRSPCPDAALPEDAASPEDAALPEDAARDAAPDESDDDSDGCQTAPGKGGRGLGWLGLLLVAALRRRR